MSDSFLLAAQTRARDSCTAVTKETSVRLATLDGMPSDLLEILIPHLLAHRVDLELPRAALWSIPTSDEWWPWVFQCGVLYGGGRTVQTTEERRVILRVTYLNVSFCLCSVSHSSVVGHNVR
mgnify:FL=1